MNAYLAIAAIGVMAGVVVTFARTPLNLPGHKVLWWMIPVLAARVRTGAKAGATTGALAAALTALSLGGRIGGGGIVMMPMIVVAGVLLDGAAGIVEARRLAMWEAVMLMSLAGTAGNLACFVKRIAEPAGAFFSTGNLRDLFVAAVWYAAFGYVAGALGCAAAISLSKKNWRIAR